MEKLGLTLLSARSESNQRMVKGERFSHGNALALPWLFSSFAWLGWGVILREDLVPLGSPPQNLWLAEMVGLGMVGIGG